MTSCQDWRDRSWLAHKKDQACPNYSTKGWCGRRFLFQPSSSTPDLTHLINWSQSSESWLVRLCALDWLEQKPAATPALCGIVWTCLNHTPTRSLRGASLPRRIAVLCVWCARHNRLTWTPKWKSPSSLRFHIRRGPGLSCLMFSWQLWLRWGDFKTLCNRFCFNLWHWICQL